MDHGKVLVASLAGCFLLGDPAAVLAQAWLPPKGEATLSLSVQNISARWHTYSDGHREDRGPMQWNNVIPDLTYGVTDRVAVQIGLPYIISKYEGPNPHLPVGRPGIDDGTWNGSFQDLRLEVRYMASRGSVVLTPFAAGVMPSTDYEHFAHSAPGRHLKEAIAGFYVGRRLDPILPDAYVHGSYSFAVPERVLGISHDRSNADLELGYFVSPSVGVRVAGSWQVSHGGFRISEDSRATAVNFAHHDQLARDNHFNLGVGASLAVTGSVDLYASGGQTISSRNAVEGRSISVGASWSVSPARILRKRRQPAPKVAPGWP